MPDQDELLSETREYSSPACFLHEFAAGYGLEPEAPNAYSEHAPTKQGEVSSAPSVAPKSGE